MHRRDEFAIRDDCCALVPKECTFARRELDQKGMFARGGSGDPSDATSRNRRAKSRLLATILCLQQQQQTANDKMANFK